MLDTLAQIDPTQIDFDNNEHLRQLVLGLMNRIEALEQRVVVLQEENQHLRDENQRLKGEQPKPRFKAQTAASPHRDASAYQRGKPGPDRKRRLEVDQTHVREVSDLPSDARFLGYRDVVVQDLVFRRVTTRYRLKRYCSAATGRFYEAPSPGPHYGAGLRSFVLMAYYQLRIPQQKIVDLLMRRGFVISAGQVARLLTEHATATFGPEYEAIIQAGLRSSGHQHIDHTGIRQGGLNHHVAVLCTADYAAFFIHRYRNKESVRDLVRPVMGGSLSDSVKVLVSDNAGEFMTQPGLHQLCWVHEMRHYRQLKGAYFKSFRREQEAFLDRLFAYYARLRQWRADPSAAEAEALALAFDTLFSGEGITFKALRDRIALTRGRKSALLLCLRDARIPLENNEAERSLREFVVKRKVSYGPRGGVGAQAWSVMMTLVETARKQGVDFYQYVYDRLSGKHAMASLACCILES